MSFQPFFPVSSHFHLPTWFREAALSFTKEGKLCASWIWNDKMGTLNWSELENQGFSAWTLLKGFDKGTRRRGTWIGLERGINFHQEIQYSPPPLSAISPHFGGLLANLGMVNTSWQLALKSGPLKPMNTFRETLEHLKCETEKTQFHFFFPNHWTAKYHEYSSKRRRLVGITPFYSGMPLRCQSLVILN